MNYHRQIEATEVVLNLLPLIPGGSVWSYTVTHDDDGESPSVLNIYADTELWSGLIERLKLGKPVDTRDTERGDKFTSFRYGALLVSLIEEEEK